MSYTELSGVGGTYIAIDGRTVHVSCRSNVGNKTAGQTILTLPAKFRTTTQRNLATIAATYEAGGVNAQQGFSIPVEIDTNTGIIKAQMNMETNHNVVMFAFSYLLD